MRSGFSCIFRCIDVATLTVSKKEKEKRERRKGEGEDMVVKVFINKISSFIFCCYYIVWKTKIVHHDYHTSYMSWYRWVHGKKMLSRFQKNGSQNVVGVKLGRLRKNASSLSWLCLHYWFPLFYHVNLWKCQWLLINHYFVEF